MAYEFEMESPDEDILEEDNLLEEEVVEEEPVYDRLFGEDESAEEAPVESSTVYDLLGADKDWAQRVSDQSDILSRDISDLRKEYDDDTAYGGVLTEYLRSSAPKGMSDEGIMALRDTLYESTTAKDAVEALRTEYGVSEETKKENVGWDNLGSKDGQYWGRNFLPEVFGDRVRFKSHFDSVKALGYVEKLSKARAEAEQPTARSATLGTTADSAMEKQWKRDQVLEIEKSLREESPEIASAVQQALRIQLGEEFEAETYGFRPVSNDKKDMLKGMLTGITAETVDPNDPDSVGSFFGTKFEKQIIDGEINNPWELVRYGQYTAHQDQQLSALWNTGQIEDIDFAIERQQTLRKIAGDSIAESHSENWFIGGFQDAMMSVAPMGESIAIGAAANVIAPVVGTGSSVAYLAAQGQGKILYDYAEHTGEKFADMSPEKRALMGGASYVGGMAYGAVEMAFGRFGGAQGAAGRSALSKASTRFLDKYLTDTVFRSAVARGGSKIVTEWMLESVEELFQEGITHGTTTALAGDFDAMETLSVSAKAFVQSLPATFWMVGLGGSGNVIHEQMGEAKNTKWAQANITDNITIAREIGARIAEAKSKDERIEIINEVSQTHSDEVLKKQMEQQTDRRTGFRTGVDGKKLESSDWDFISNKRTRENGKPITEERTDEEIEARLPQDFEFTELFIKAARGDKQAQKEYNREVIGKGKSPDVLYQLSESGEVDFEIGTEKIEDAKNNPLYQELYNMGAEKLVKRAASFVEMGIELDPEMTAVINDRYENSSDFKALVFREIGDRKVSQLRSNIENRIANPKTGKKISMLPHSAAPYAERAYSELNEAFSGLENYLNNLPDVSFNVGENSHTELVKLKRALQTATQTGDIDTVRQVLSELGAQVDRPFAQRIMKATQSFATSKRVAERAKNWQDRTEVAPIVRDMAEKLNIDEERAVEVYAVWEAMGLPMHRIQFKRDQAGNIIPEIKSDNLIDRIDELEEKVDEGVELSEAEANELAVLNRIESAPIGTLIRFDNGVFESEGNHRYKTVPVQLPSENLTDNQLMRMDQEDLDSNDDGIPTTRSADLRAEYLSVSADVEYIESKLRGETKEGEDITLRQTLALLKEALGDVQLEIYEAAVGKRFQPKETFDIDAPVGVTMDRASVPLFQIPGYRLEEQTDSNGEMKWYAIDQNGLRASKPFKSEEAILEYFESAEVSETLYQASQEVAATAYKVEEQEGKWYAIDSLGNRASRPYDSQNAILEKFEPQQTLYQGQPRKYSQWNTAKDIVNAVTSNPTIGWHFRVQLLNGVYTEKQSEKVREALTTLEKKGIIKKEDPAQETGVLFQKKAKESAKGQIDFSTGDAVITAFENSDITTAIHEGAHAARRFLFDRNADTTVRVSDDDIALTESLYGVADGKWSTEQEENFAKDFEAYMLKGKAPTRELQSTFEKIARWMAEIYSKIVRQVSPEMQGVFDRLIAREEGLTDLAETVGINKGTEEENIFRERARLERDALFEEFDLAGLSFSKEEGELVIGYLAKRQNYPDAPNITREELPEYADMLIETWDKGLGNILSRLKEASKILGRDFQGREQYFTLRHKADDRSQEASVIARLEVASDALGKHREGSYGGVIKDPAEQLRLYLEDVAEFLSLAEHIGDLRSYFEETDESGKQILLPESIGILHDAVRGRKAQRAGKEPTASEGASLAILEELRKVEELGKGVNIVKSIYYEDDFLDIVERDMDVGTRDIEDSIGQKMMGSFDPSMVTVWMDGTSHETMRETGQFGGANYLLRYQLISAKAEYTANSSQAMKRVKDSIRSNLAKKGIFGSKEIKELELKLGTIWNDKKQKRLLLDMAKAGYRPSATATKLGLSSGELTIALDMVDELTLAAQAREGRPQLRTEHSQMQTDLRREFSQLTLAREGGKRLEEYKTQEEQDTRLKFLEKVYTVNDAALIKSTLKKAAKGLATKEEIAALKNELTNIRGARNAVTNWIFEMNALNKGEFFNFYESMIDRGYRDAIIGKLHTKVDTYVKYLNATDRAEFANWWDRIKTSNIEGMLSEKERNLIELAAKATKGVKKFGQDVLRTISGGKIDINTGELESDYVRGLITASQKLHRARITAWLSGNISWSLKTQPTSLAMTAKHVGTKVFGKTLATFAYRDLVAAFQSIQGIPETLMNAKDLSTKDTIRSLTTYWRNARTRLQVEGLEESKVLEVKGSGKNLGRVAESSEHVHDKIRQTFREFVKNKAGELSGAVESRTVAISFIAGKIHGKQLGLDEQGQKMYGDYIADVTQSMYDLVTRNPNINNNIMKAVAPMQSYVFSAWSNVWDLMNVTGIEKDGKLRAKEAVTWYAAMRTWEILISMVLHGDDPEEAMTDPSYRKSFLSSVIPYSSAVPYISVDNLQRRMANFVLPEKWEADISKRPTRDPLNEFVRKTERAFLDKDNEKPNFIQRQAMLEWAMQYLAPHMGIPGTKLGSELSRVAFIADNEGRNWDIKGNNYSYYPTLTGEDDLDAWLSYLKTTLFSKSSLEKVE